MINITISETAPDGEILHTLAQKTISIEASKVWDRLTPSPYVLYGGLKNAIDVNNESYSALFLMNMSSMMVAAALFAIVMFRRLTCWERYHMKESMMPY